MKCKSFALPGLMAVLLLTGCAAVRESWSKPHFEEIGGCSHENELPALELTDAHKQLLAKRADPPRTAADYYLALPESFFGNVEDTTPERRVSFIEMENLSDQWLKARHFFECDGGGFEVVMRVFDTADDPLIAIDEWKHRFEDIHRADHPPAGEMQSISLGVPDFWRFTGGKWVKADDVKLPSVDKDWVMERYRSDFESQFKTQYQSTYIWLNYELPKTGDEIRLVGRANYMDPYGEYVWRTLKFDGRNFTDIPSRKE